MQYTGFNYMNGVEIYEGDVLYYESFETNINNRIVELLKGCFVGRLMRSDTIKLLKDCYKDTIIIGNIYENPELLDNYYID